MYLELTKKDIINSYSSYQLEVKKKYLLDLLFYTPDLSGIDRIAIHDLLRLIEERVEYFREEQSA